MKFKVLFLRRKYIYYTVILILTLILIFLYFITKPKETIATFTISKPEEAVKADFDGDGDNELLIISSNQGKFNLQITSNTKNIHINPDKVPNTLGNQLNYWHLRIILLDVNRDNLPEILLQGYNEKKPIQHIFAIEENDYIPLLSTTNNILGVLNVYSNKTPIVFTGNLINGDIKFNANLMLLNNVKSVSGTYEASFAGRDTIISFIKFIEAFPYTELLLPKKLDSGLLSTSDYNVINKLFKSGKRFVFQDGFFSDRKYDKDGEISELNWILNFKTVTPNAQNSEESCILNLILKSSKDTSYHYKISSIKLEEKK
ncbi:FG-GAP repeat domain-containing protein [Clostridium cellulovorans]|uniref:FG-GAP repeat protein n=1 Tax=Clostridium cellulovorans (strain ATCC 35296 / DSM 3052 / OCM 3 / 743B) TaxID=573061 RepID=D9SWW2_CLOC7|nr:VCBS repeat-containing protein [Clostridium cellulovorans]ADL51323.1 hypothetical protein Clocel_1575 [Clostridium cellulovorans 743B]